MKNITRLVGMLIFLVAALQAETGQGGGFSDILDSAKKIGGTGGHFRESYDPSLLCL